MRNNVHFHSHAVIQSNSPICIFQSAETNLRSACSVVRVDLIGCSANTTSNKRSNDLAILRRIEDLIVENLVNGTIQDSGTKRLAGYGDSILLVAVRYFPAPISVG